MTKTSIRFNSGREMIVDVPLPEVKATLEGGQGFFRELALPDGRTIALNLNQVETLSPSDSTLTVD